MSNEYQLSQAILNNDSEVALALLEGATRIDVNWRSHAGLSLLHQAAQNRLPLIVERLVAMGADVNALDRFGNSVLKYASAEPDVEMLDAFRLLIESGADPCQPDRRGYTALHCAACHGEIAGAAQMAQHLLSAGADINAQGSVCGDTPLHSARSVEMVELLLTEGANPLIQNRDGQIPRETLIEEGEVELAEVIRLFMTMD